MKTMYSSSAESARRSGSADKEFVNQLETGVENSLLRLCKQGQKFLDHVVINVRGGKTLSLLHASLAVVFSKLRPTLPSSFTGTVKPSHIICKRLFEHTKTHKNCHINQALVGTAALPSIAKSSNHLDHPLAATVVVEETCTSGPLLTLQLYPPFQREYGPIQALMARAHGGMVGMAYHWLSTYRLGQWCEN
jgi:hypothetical protein